MRNHIVLLIVINASWLASAKIIRVECPSYCICEYYSNLKKATCVNRTIVVADLDLPSQTQILDVSYNQISELNENVFIKNKLMQLQLLNMSHNRIGEINIFAFKGLKRLKVLDLSYNSVQRIHSQWFNDLSKLEHLFLRGNHFGDTSRLQDYSFNSEKLKVLDLSKSYITFLKSEIFNLPQLNHLDLTGNQLITLNQDILSQLKSLKVLKIKDNFLTCNEEMLILKKLLNSRNIQYDDDPCKQQKSKFERIIMKPATTAYNDNSYWIIDDKGETEKDDPVEKIPCQTFQKENSMVNLSELPYSLFIITVLFYGILIGLVCGCSVKSCKMRHKMRHYRGKCTVHLKKIKYLENETQLLTSNEIVLGNSTPVFIRK
ncbi:amphoterin-induced protein 1-like [Harmonia axyridis]|uniref:amphoterin-induced protein 1-like n=1 Tax=Harmonia axyridis TaxID=115357 RepID=UPI001E2755E6|nr:amphoterin-induced protein 1-like [Harmonia axyridis]